MAADVEFRTAARRAADGPPFRLSDAALAEVERLAQRYARRDALLLPVLWMVQRQEGWISPAAMQHVAEVVRVSPARVLGVVTFYHMFHEHPPGKYNVQVCHNLSCSLLGAETLIEHLQAKWGVGIDEPTADGRFMIQRVECLGACEHAPVCQINDDWFFDATVETLERQLDGLP